MVTVAVPADHEADADWFDHPPIVQDSEPKEMYEDPLVMDTVPVTVTAPEVERRAPPESRRLPFTLSAYVDFVRIPAASVREVAPSCEACVTVPVIVSVAKLCPASSFTLVEVPDNMTLPVPGSNEEVAPLVSQDPETVHAPEVMDRVDGVPSANVTLPSVTDDVLAARAPEVWIVRLAPPVRAYPAVVREPDTTRAWLTSTALARVIVPEAVRL